MKKPRIKKSKAKSAAASAEAPTPRQVQHAKDQQAFAQASPYNESTAREHGTAHARAPSIGASTEAPSPSAGCSTLSESNQSPKTGSAHDIADAVPGTLSRHRVDSAGRMLTTNHGVRVADNQSSLKAGLRGPTLLEDFILREKITHFDHERIPERVVHARGSGAHGYFEAYESLDRWTKATVFAEAGKTTPVFVRFSTVAGERGSADTARDVRGFAVKFYTDQGNWDLVGNNIPVFFVQDALKFPDLIHSVKPEPHNGMPQAASAHDTFWDFVSLMPESTHTLMWVMSDRGIPRSYRMMQGFGVHTFRLVNDRQQAHFCKFHWKPMLGTHSLVWDEAAKLAGADPDFHRRDLWEAIESGEYPEWELGLQVFTEAQAQGFSFDVLDATKLIPEELVPVTPVGRMVLNRNPDNFFAETEQVAFCTAHVIPGIDFSNDPLLQGRIHSYIDTQITRLGGVNFHEIPINAPLAPVHNNQRDGLHRQTIARGRIAYEPNSLGGGCPFQAGMQGFVPYAEKLEAQEGAVEKLRGKPEKFAEHYLQATLFYNSQSPVERAHIVAAFRFELSKVTVPAVRERMVSSLVNVSVELARAVASGLGIPLPDAMPRALRKPPVPEIKLSPELSLNALPGAGGVRTRKVAILLADGFSARPIARLQEQLIKQGAVPVLVGVRTGPVESVDGGPLVAQASLENSPSVKFDGVILPDGDAAVDALAADAHALEHLAGFYRHGKTILALGSSANLLKKARIPTRLPSGGPDPGIVVAQPEEISDAAMTFIAALAKHRHPSRDRDPPTL